MRPHRHRVSRDYVIDLLDVVDGFHTYRCVTGSEAERAGTTTLGRVAFEAAFEPILDAPEIGKRYRPRVEGSATLSRELLVTGVWSGFVLARETSSNRGAHVPLDEFRAFYAPVPDVAAKLAQDVGQH